MGVDWEGIVGGVILVIIMAMLVERAAAFIFDWRWWKKFHLFDLNGKGLKSIVVLGISWVMCSAADFSILQMAFGADRGSWYNPHSIGRRRREQGSVRPLLDGDRVTGASRWES